MNQPSTISEERQPVVLAQFILSALMRQTPFSKRLRKLERIEDAALSELKAAVGRSNVYNIGSLRRGDRPEQMDAERQFKRDLAAVVLKAVEAERAVIASFGFPSPGHPVPGRQS